MKKTILNRYGEERYVEQLSPKEYLIWGNSAYNRIGETYIDFEGGPLIYVNRPFDVIGLQRDVLSITPTTLVGKPNCFKIILHE